MSRGLAVVLALLALLARAAPASAQYVQINSVEVTPFAGVRFGGTLDLQAGSPTEATLKDGSSYGFSAGVRFDDVSLIEFRWTHVVSALRFDAPLVSLGDAIGDVTLNQFLMDFTREWDVTEVKGLRSYLVGSVGATHVSAAHDAFTRFSFGLGGGLKEFLGSHFAIRAEARWMGIWINPEVGAFACGTVAAGGCVVVLTGPVTQQFELTIAPVLRF
jgi:hypothetical protein